MKGWKRWKRKGCEAQQQSGSAGHLEVAGSIPGSSSSSSLSEEEEEEEEESLRRRLLPLTAADPLAVALRGGLRRLGVNVWVNHSPLDMRRLPAHVLNIRASSSVVVR